MTLLVLWVVIKADFHSANVSRATDAIRNSECFFFFFQSPFDATEIFGLLNQFVLFTNEKEPLKCVRQSGYLDF